LGDGDGLEDESEQEIITFLSGNNLTKSEKKWLQTLELSTESEIICSVRQLMAEIKTK
jgi:hypothetical protein